MCCSVADVRGKPAVAVVLTAYCKREALAALACRLMGR